jgi:Glycosyl transferase family 2
MPRADVLRKHGPETDPLGYSFRSGFWTILPFPAEGLEEIEIELIATLSNGHVSTSRLGKVRFRRRPVLEPVQPKVAPAARGAPLVAICMATYNPRMDLFRRQAESLRAQTHRNWLCVISDDDSRPDIQAAIRDELEGDDRFHFSASERRRGYYHNFERALSLVPREADLVSLCDQDDRWDPEKLERLHKALDPGTSLAYCDMRIVDPRGSLISPTYWTERRTNHTNLISLMVANTITAAATLFPRRLLDVALPFPERMGHAFHDHWLAMVALATGRIAYVDEPLYDYVQHGENAYGTSGARWPPRRLPRPPRPSRTAVSLGLLRWRSDYFHYACAMQLHADVLFLRAGQVLRGRKRRAVQLIRASKRPLASLVVAAWLWLRARGARLRRSPTMGMERLVARGLVWRLLIRSIGRLRRRNQEHHAQALPVPAPPSIEPDHERAPLREPPVAVEQITRKVAPLEIEVRHGAPKRVNVLIPTVDLDHFFGAYIGKFNLSRRLAEAGLRVRLVAVDPTILPSDWREQLGRYSGLKSLLDRVEVEFAPSREQLRLEVSSDDCFVATTSWTAHLAHRATTDLGRKRFIFVIQEYDALTYPVGTLGSVVREAYSHPHFAVFSTELLRGYFRRHRIGVYSNGKEEGNRASVAFQNAITDIAPPDPETLRGQRPRLLFYARPEAHAERNMFELGLIGLAEAIQAGVFRGKWEFHGVGAQRKGRIKITDEATLQLFPRRPQSSYRALLLEHCVGLSLMDTPHPSLVPLEMASAGMPVVTSTFENKTAESLRAISTNLIPVEPTVSGVRRGLAEAVHAVNDIEGRLRGTKVNWSRSWETSFDDAFIARVTEFVEGA